MTCPRGGGTATRREMSFKGGRTHTRAHTHALSLDLEAVSKLISRTSNCQQVPWAKIHALRLVCHTLLGHYLTGTLLQPPSKTALAVWAGCPVSDRELRALGQSLSARPEDGARASDLCRTAITRGNK